MYVDERLVKLYVITKEPRSVEFNKNVFTNAPDDIIAKICEDIKNDDIIHSAAAKMDAVIGVLHARGYTCNVLSEIPTFGFKE